MSPHVDLPLLYEPQTYILYVLGPAISYITFFTNPYIF